MDSDNGVAQELANLEASSEAKSVFHRSRERRYEMLDRWARILAFLAALLGISQLFAAYSTWLFVAAVVFMMPGAIMAWSYKAKRHAQLACEYIALQSAVCAVRSPQWTDVDTFRSAFIRIGAVQPLR